MEISDPYEQYLLAVFESCDDYHHGGLSAAGLQQLCEKLQLDESCGKLTDYLLGDYKSKRVLFQEFKDGLLRLLDEMQCEQRTDGEISPVQGISPRNVFGKNKHGRRSRADNNDNDGNSSDTLFERHQNQLHTCSTDDSSSDEAAPKKRRTRDSKKKGKKSGKNELITEDRTASSTTNTTNEVEHLITAWSNISSEGTDSLNRDELVKVFQCVGLERGSEEAAQCVFEKLGIDGHGKITLQELLEFIKSGESWNRESRNQHMELESSQKNVPMDFTEPSIFGYITGAGLIEQWEYAGVPGAAQLLQNLGFSPGQQIDLSSLVSMLSDEIKGLNDETKSTRRTMDPHLALLRANSVLQYLYIQSLKTMMEHVNAEKEKFRNDVFEANQRALLLAQEVDDHHSKLEHSSQQQVKFLEQKHTEKIRELTSQAKFEQDALLAQNTTLEQKLKILEVEEAKNKAVISQLELENRVLEQENRTTADQLTAAKSAKEKLEEALDNVAALQEKIRELETTMSENDAVSLLERIRTLEKENTELRDRNDELTVEIEELSTKLSNTSIKKRSNISTVDPSKDENFCGGGTKRRGDSSFEMVESTEDSGGEEGSPRLGKVRKCSHMKDFAETTSSLEELELDDKKDKNLVRSAGKDSSERNQGFVEVDKDENERGLIARTERGKQVPTLLNTVPFSEELEQANAEATAKLAKAVDVGVVDASKLEEVEKKLRVHNARLAEEVVSILRMLMKQNTSCKESEEKLRARCEELEASLESLKEEYDKTEDYWSEKLEEERTYFENEQRLSDEKYSELVNKILEYEKMLNTEMEQRQRLETIEERDSFEKQVADMEQECEDLKRQLAEVIEIKDGEIERLKNEIKNSKVSGDCVDTEVQVSCLDEVDAVAASEGQNAIENSQSVVAQEKSSSCKNCVELRNLQEAKFRYQKEIDLMKGEWERLFREINESKRILSTVGNMAAGAGDGERARNVYLEQRCHSLLMTLRQQQKQTGDILKNTFRQHKVEVNDLKSVIKMTEDKLKRQAKVIHEQLNKLAKTDLLVKDLFVENAYLLSSVQKLEQECRTSSKSVGTG